VDINRLGQSQATIWNHHIALHEARWSGFGWKVLSVDGHDVSQLLHAYEDAQSADRPTVVLAKTVKCKGIPVAEGREDYHGKPLGTGDAEKTVAFLEQQLSGSKMDWKPKPISFPPPRIVRNVTDKFPKAPYTPGSDKVARPKRVQ